MHPDNDPLHQHHHHHRGSRVVQKLLPKAKNLAGSSQRWLKQHSRDGFVSNTSDSDVLRGRISGLSSERPESFHQLGVASRGDGGFARAHAVDGHSEDAEAEDGLTESPVSEDFGVELRSSPARPWAPSTHPSQIGHLTTSSPIIQAQHVAEVQSLDSLAHSYSHSHSHSHENNSKSDGLERPATFSFSTSTPSLLLPGKVPTIPISESDYDRWTAATAKVEGNDLRPLEDPGRARSKSPAGRIKGVFSRKKSQQTLPRALDLDTDVARPSTAGSLVPQPGFKLFSKSADNVVVVPPRTPPQLDAEVAKPVIVNTPPTPTDSFHPVASASSPTRPISEPISPSLSSNPNITISPSGHMISHRRARSGSASSAGPSKLSKVTLAPLTPTLEKVPSPSPQLQSQSTSSSQQNSPGGFFSSVLSVAQNAASTLSSTVTNTGIGGGGGNKIKNQIPGESKEGDDNTTEVESSAPDQGVEVKMSEPAVKTLGMGDLSLSQLGIADSGSTTPTPLAARFPDKNLSGSRNRSDSAPAAADAHGSTSVNGSGDGNGNGNGKNGDGNASGSTNTNTNTNSNGNSDSNSHGNNNGNNNSGNSTIPVLTPDDLVRPKSLYESAGERTPPASVYEDKPGVHRSGSIRSAIERRRKRGSTGGTTGTNGTAHTIGAAIAAANASVAHPSVGGAPKLTGFAVASKKRNRDFHSFFKSVPDDDYLIEDYSCALQREILAHGRLYVSEGHLCFSSNILGWVTTLVMSFDEIVSVEKRSTALVFKNGLMISTLHAKHVFASFTSRDSTYDLIVNIWKLGHPTLRSSLNGVSLEGTGGDKTEKIDDLEEPVLDHSGSGSEICENEHGNDSDEDEDEVYDEDEEDLVEPPSTQPTNGGSAEGEADKGANRKVSGNVAINGSSEKPKDGPPGPSGEKDYPGPATHAPTDCGESGSHFDRFLCDETIPAPLGKVYNLMFGPASPKFMGNWLTNEQKCTDLQMEDKIGLTQENKSRGYSYIKPLYASIGPRSTKCITTETLENLDLEKAVTVVVVTLTPDVPSGNVFSVRTRYCLSWAENNSTRMMMNCDIVWTGKSWLKNPIEKGANDGQIQYGKDIVAILRTTVSSGPRSTLAASASAKGRKLRKNAGKAANKLLAPGSKDAHPGSAAAAAAARKTNDWGLLEPLHDILGPVVDIVKPIFTPNIIYGILVGLLVATWFSGNAGAGRGRDVLGGGSGFGPDVVDRRIAYEELWRHEESELWDWLEERVGLHRLHGNVGDGGSDVGGNGGELRGKMKKMVKEERMGEREMEEAIRVTEEKLGALKMAREREKRKGGVGGV